MLYPIELRGRAKILYHLAGYFRLRSLEAESEVHALELGWA